MGASRSIRSVASGVPAPVESRPAAPGWVLAPGALGRRCCRELRRGPGDESARRRVRAFRAEEGNQLERRHACRNANAGAREHERILAEGRIGIARQIARGAALRGRGGRQRSELLAEGVMGVTHGLALWWQAHPDVPMCEIVHSATDLVVPGLVRLARLQRR
jgi:hypothetical protein